MERNYIIVSMFTEKTPYEREAQQLKQSCDKFGLETKIYPVKNLGDWTKNTQQKADIVLTALKEFPDKDIVWLDADALVFSEPVFFDTLKDKQFNICIHRWHPHYNKNPTGEVLSGTMYLKNNQKTIDMVSDWIEQNKKETNWDQRTLIKILDTKKYKEIQLPSDYVKMKPRNGIIDNVGGVIRHKQVSREHRNKMGTYK